VILQIFKIECVLFYYEPAGAGPFHVISLHLRCCELDRNVSCAKLVFVYFVLYKLYRSNRKDITTLDLKCSNINKNGIDFSSFMFELDIFIERLCCVEGVSSYSTVGLINAQSSECGVTLVTSQTQLCMINFKI